MTKTTFPETDAPTANTPAARLLDLLLGWAEYRETRATAPDYEVSENELFDLYQEAGGRIADLPKGDAEAERQVIITFLIDRVLPILLRTPAEARRQAAA